MIGGYKSGNFENCYADKFASLLGFDGSYINKARSALFASDAKKLTFNLKESRTIEEGDELIIYSTNLTPWDIRNSISDDCKIPFGFNTEVGRLSVAKAT